MKKLLRYLVNTILFVLLWCLMFLPVMKLSIDTGGTSIAAIGGIIAIFISYGLVKRINKSNLWARLFDETETVNDEVEENKVELNKSNIFNPKNIIIAILTIVLITVLYNQNNNEYNTALDKEISVETKTDKSDLDNTNKELLNKYSSSEVKDFDWWRGELTYYGLVMGGVSKIDQTDQPFRLKSNDELVNGVICYTRGRNQEYYVESNFTNGRIDGETRVYYGEGGQLKHIFILEEGYNKGGREPEFKMVDYYSKQKLYKRRIFEKNSIREIITTYRNDGQKIQTTIEESGKADIIIEH